MYAIWAEELLIQASVQALSQHRLTKPTLSVSHTHTITFTHT